MVNTKALTVVVPRNHSDEMFCFKNKQTTDAIITSLHERINRLSEIKLEFCYLTAPQIKVLSNMLVNNHTIIEVSVNGNPNEEQNFYLLLHKTNINALSLKFCSINYEGVGKIVDELYTPFKSPLIHLNLSSNSISDEGVEHLACLLKLNRTLMSLNVADNKIHDIGCFALMEPLQKFELDFEEVVERRRIKFKIQREIMQLQSEIEAAKDKKPKNKECNDAENSEQKNFVNRDLESHPFMLESYENYDSIYCKGNDVLFNMNLSYNRITRQGLSVIIKMLDYQVTNYAHDRGISRISIEGNDLGDCENKVWKFKELLMIKSKNGNMNVKKNNFNLRHRSYV